MNQRWIVTMVAMSVWAVAADAQAFSATYDQKVTRGTEVFTAKVLIKDDKFRIEATVAHQPSVTIRNASGIYTYLVNEGMAMKLPMLDPSQPAVPDANYPAYLNEHHATLLRSETVDGLACDVYRYADPTVQGTTTVWVWKEKQFPIRVEMEAANGTTVVELTHLQFDVAAADEAFELPAGVKMMDMGPMLNTMPQMSDPSGSQQEP